MQPSSKQTKFQTVEEYIEAQPAGVQNALQRVRDAIRQAVPGAEERISYNMPTYKLQGASLLSFAAWKQHYALYVASKPIVEAFKSELQRCEIDTGTIRFSFEDPVPHKLIERIAQLRAKQLSQSHPAPG